MSYTAIGKRRCMNAVVTCYRRNNVVRNYAMGGTTVDYMFGAIAGSSKSGTNTIINCLENGTSSYRTRSYTVSTNHSTNRVINTKVRTGIAGYATAHMAIMTGKATGNDGVERRVMNHLLWSAAFRALFISVARTT